MKRVILMTAIALLAIANVKAENFSIGAQLGFAAPIMRTNIGYPSASKLIASPKLYGTKLGIVLDGDIYENFGASIALNYTFGSYAGKWQEFTYGYSILKSRTRAELHQLEVAVDWQYKFELARETYVIIYTGPAIQWNIKYDATEYISYMDGKEKESHLLGSFNYDDGDLTNDFLRYNVTWGVGVGFQFKRYFIRGGYDFGIVNPIKHKYLSTDYSTELTEAETRYRTKGRLDAWNIKFGIYFWQNND